MNRISTAKTQVSGSILLTVPFCVLQHRAFVKYLRVGHEIVYACLMECQVLGKSPEFLTTGVPETLRVASTAAYVSRSIRANAGEFLLPQL